MFLFLGMPTPMDYTTTIYSWSTIANVYPKSSTYDVAPVNLCPISFDGFWNDGEDSRSYVFASVYVGPKIDYGGSGWVLDFLFVVCFSCSS